MKRTGAILLVLVLSFCYTMTGFAEEDADQQAEKIFTELADLYNTNLNYLDHTVALFKKLSGKTPEKPDSVWFNNTFVFGLDDQESARFYHFARTVRPADGDIQYGFLFETLFMPLYETALKNQDHDTAVVTACVMINQLFYYDEKSKEKLETQKQALRSFKKNNPDYPLMDDLQELYKETLSIVEYTDNGFADTIESDTEHYKKQKTELRGNFDLDFDWPQIKYSEISEDKTQLFTEYWQTKTALEPHLYDGISGPVVNDRLVVYKDGKYGMIDITGKVTVALNWDQISINDDLAIVKRDGKTGLMDLNGNMIAECQWDSVDGFHEGIAVVKKNGLYGYINKSGEQIIECQWANAYEFSHGIACVFVDHKAGFINTDGDYVIPCIWDNALFTGSNIYDEDVIAVEKDGLWGFIDYSGEIVIPCRWNHVMDFSEGLARVVDENRKYGFINHQGELVIPCRFDLPGHSFREGRACFCVKDNGKSRYGYMDALGNVVIPAVYRQDSDFSGGMAVQKTDNGYAVIGIMGNVILETPYGISRSSGDIIVFRDDTKTGCMDISGHIIIPAEYSVINPGDEYIACCRDNYVTIFDLQGNPVF